MLKKMSAQIFYDEIYEVCEENEWMDNKAFLLKLGSSNIDL